MKARILSSVAVLAAATLMITGCTQSKGAQTTSDPTLTVSVPYDNNSFDSSNLQGGMELYWGPVYDTLLKHSGGKVVANAATSFVYSGDKSKLTLTLRKGMKFSDGTAVDAAAVKSTMERLKAGTGASAGYLGSVDTIEAPDGFTVVLGLSAPDPVLLDYLTQAAGVIANPKAFTKKDFNRLPAGSGPYTLDSSKSTQGVQYTFKKNPNYWDAKSYPYPTMVTKVMTDQTARLNALISGQLNFGMIDTASVAQAKASRLTVTTVLDGWVGMMIGDRDGKLAPQLKDVRVRQAINYAFDRDTIVKKLFAGVGRPTDSTFDVDSEAFNEQADKTYGFDPTKARTLMAAAGHAAGFDLTLPTSPRSTPLDATIKQSLGDIGIRVKYTQLTDEQITPALLKATYPLFWFGDESQSAYYDIKKCLLPNAIWNPFHTTDPTVAALAKTAQLATSPSVAHEAYQQLGKYIVDQAWFVPFTKSPNNFVTDAKTKFTATEKDPQVFPRNFAPAL